MNPFTVLEQVQRDYRKYVESFQLIASPDVPPLLAHEIEHGDLLWKEPYIQITPRWKKGCPLADLIADGTIHPDCKKVFYSDEKDRNSESINSCSRELNFINSNCNTRYKSNQHRNWRNWRPEFNRWFSIAVVLR